MYQWKSAKVVRGVVVVWEICFCNNLSYNVYNVGILQVGKLKSSREKVTFSAKNSDLARIWATSGFEIWVIYHDENMPFLYTAK